MIAARATSEAPAEPDLPPVVVGTAREDEVRVVEPEEGVVEEAGEEVRRAGGEEHVRGEVRSRLHARPARADGRRVERDAPGPDHSRGQAGRIEVARAEEGVAEGLGRVSRGKAAVVRAPRPRA